MPSITNRSETVAQDPCSSLRRLRAIPGQLSSLTVGLAVIGVLVVFVEPVVAQSTGESFCETNLAATVKNLFQVVQYGGPLLGGLLALGATVALPAVRRSDAKRELKEVRNQGVLWGVIVAPLGTTIVRFLLDAVVVGGTSCAF